MATRKMPKGCKCDPDSWWDGEKIKPICRKYKHLEDAALPGGECQTCYHGRACHKQRKVKR